MLHLQGGHLKLLSVSLETQREVLEETQDMREQDMGKHVSSKRTDKMDAPMDPL